MGCKATEVSQARAHFPQAVACLACGRYQGMFDDVESKIQEGRQETETAIVIARATWLGTIAGFHN